MATLEELIEQKNAIEARIAELRQEKRAEALREVRHFVSTYQITADELYGQGNRIYPSGTSCSNEAR